MGTKAGKTKVGIVQPSGHNIPEHLLIPPPEWVAFWEWLLIQPMGPSNFGHFSPLKVPYVAYWCGAPTPENSLKVATVDDPLRAIEMARSSLEAELKHTPGGVIYWRTWPQLNVSRDNSNLSILWTVYARYLISGEKMADDAHFDMSAEDTLADHVDHLDIFKKENNL